MAIVAFVFWMFLVCFCQVRAGIEPATKAAQPYAFGYDIKDGHGNSQTRHETSDEWGHKRGHYGYTDAWGIYRVVDYVADHNGYRARVRTNEPGTSNQSPAGVKMQAEPSPLQAYRATEVLKTPAYVAPSPVYAKAVVEPYVEPTYARASLGPVYVDSNPVYAKVALEPAFQGYESKSKAIVYAPKVLRKRIVRRRKKIGHRQYIPSFKGYDSSVPYGVKIVNPVGHGNLDLPLYKDK